MEEANGDRMTWSYDAIYQLTRERRSGANSYDVTYTYDATGNQLTKVDSGTTTTYSYDAANRQQTEQTGANITTYSYDNNGNTTLKNAAGQRTTYTWDHENRMTKLEQPTSPAVMTFTYDGQSFRRTLHNGTALTKFLNDWRTGTPGLDPVLMETDGAGIATATYTYGLGLVSQRRAATTNYYHYEAIGTTRQLTDANQAVTDTYVYNAWGNQVNSAQPTTNPYRYVGEENYYRDGQSGLMLLGVRYYDSGVGGFILSDPMQEDHNWFAYSGNNPVNSIDPSGLYQFTCKEVKACLDKDANKGQCKCGGKKGVDWATTACVFYLESKLDTTPDDDNFGGIGQMICGTINQMRIWGCDRCVWCPDGSPIAWGNRHIKFCTCDVQIFPICRPEGVHCGRTLPTGSLCVSGCTKRPVFLDTSWYDACLLARIARDYLDCAGVSGYGPCEKLIAREIAQCANCIRSGKGTCIQCGEKFIAPALKKCKEAGL